MQKILIVLLLIICLPVILGILGIAWYNNEVSKPQPNTQTSFEIASGDSVSTIVSNLSDKGIISNELVFTLYLKSNPELANNIKAGVYQIPAQVTLPELAELIQDITITNQGVKILVPEGLRYDEIADIFESKLGSIEANQFSRAEFINIVENPDKVEFPDKIDTFLKSYKPVGKNLEGFLYPDTYFFNPEDTAQDVMEVLLGTFVSKLSDTLLAKVNSSNYSLYEYLTLASILEREAFTNEEKPVIAGILFNRLEEGVEGVRLLQADATLLYIAKDWKANVIELKSTESAYNTYKSLGLPPTPISNPGIITLESSINPDDNQYYYYIHDDQGQVYYASTLSQHNQNVRNYL